LEVESFTNESDGFRKHGGTDAERAFNDTSAQPCPSLAGSVKAKDLEANRIGDVQLI
jgi:hypothetical protein